MKFTLVLCVIVGLIAFFIVLVAFYRYQWSTWGSAENALVSRFPKELPVKQEAVKDLQA
ncbi:MAG TPA: hypothetical protein VKX46_13135 [Ktedonobacteraceae bacterium]|nr:hypothetical protein [Ktedonobacteraceae bacterium]